MRKLEQSGGTGAIHASVRMF